MLVTSFLLQGVRFAYADESVTISETVPSIEEVASPSDVAEEIVVEEVTGLVPAELDSITSETETDPEIPLVVSEGTSAESDLENDLSDSVVGLLPGVVDPTSSTSLEATTTIDVTTTEAAELPYVDSTVPDEDSTPPPNSGNTTLESDDLPEQPEPPGDTGDNDQQSSEDDTATTSNEVDLIVDDSATTTGGFTAYVESDSVFSFDKNECTKLASGSFYCQEVPTDVQRDALFSAPDVDGDTEIYFVKDGVQSQVTSNLTDDAAPYYDNNSNTIVWHRLLDDRYQIISYDIESGKETVLTNTKENNMEPTRQGKYTVWQRWINGGWNIVLHDGNTERQITRTSSHNVAPYIHGTLVVWNRHNISGEKTIEMYDITNETYVTINDSEGMSVSNPRMVFVYDSLNASGDVVTRGYDILAKQFIDLDTLPRPIPEQIPESDSTGETRALIQNKPTLKSEVEEQLENEMSPDPDPDINLNNALSHQATGTESVSPTLDLRTDSATTTVLQVDEITSYDIVVPPFSTSTEAVNE